jgi:hypothetical protein
MILEDPLAVRSRVPETGEKLLAADVSYPRSAGWKKKKGKGGGRAALPTAHALVFTHISCDPGWCSKNGA